MIANDSMGNGVGAARRSSLAVVIGIVLLSTSGLNAGDSGKVTVTVPMVRIVVATNIPAVNQTYELEIDSFDGQSLRGFEPQKDPSSVRAMISISMASVLKIQFYNTAIERDAPKPAPSRSLPGDPPPTGSEGPPQKDFLKRLESLDTERGEYQFFKTVQSMKDLDFRLLEARLDQMIGSAESEDKIKIPAKAALMAAYFHDCLDQARKFEHMTRVEYYLQTGNLLKQAQKDALAVVKENPNQPAQTAGQKVIEAPELDARRLLWASWAWNAVAPPDRAEDPALRKPGPGGKPFKGLHGPPGRPAETQP
ncbi:MAG TPA: hypothetical protein VL860_04245 [Planctomycetota bacterium]|nr:hypothetical protein [Planctomycetota bacterium]